MKCVICLELWEYGAILNDKFICEKCCDRI